MIAKGFSTARSGGRKCSAQISIIQTFLDISSLHKLVQEASVEAVTGSHGVNCFNPSRGRLIFFSAAHRHAAFCTALDNDSLDARRKLIQCGLQVIATGYIHGVTL